MGNLFCPSSHQTKINQEERALLDCKLCRDKIKKYIKSLEQKASQKKEKAKEALKNKNRDKAKLYMRQSKMYQEQIKASDGQLDMIETQITQIESAQSQKDVFTVLKEGNNVLKKLQEEVNVEKLEEISDDLNESNSWLIEKDMQLLSKTGITLLLIVTPESLVLQSSVNSPENQYPDPAAPALANLTILNLFIFF